MADTALAALKPYPQNYNRHSEEQIKRLMESLERFGQPKEIVTWNGTIIAGHGLVEAARRLGLPTLRARDMTMDWTETEALAFMAADNELARLADPDEAALAQLMAGLGDIDAQLAALAAGTEERLKELLATLKEPDDDPGAQIDKAEELREKWGVESGQLWSLDSGNGNPHRLICGDCTDAAVVARVMGGEKAGAVATDVPYEISQQSNGLRRLDYGEWDKAGATDAAFDALSLCADVPTITAFCGDEQLSLIFALWSNRTKRTVVWVKPNPTVINGEHVFLPACELAAHGRLSGAWFGGKCVRSVWEGTAPTDRNHPNEKPLGLIEWVVSLTCDAGAIVYDPFLGSGTTLIACERLGRKCRAVEISPAYCAVAIQRWVDMTGGTPEKING